jgi:hypothetical protein
MIAASSGKPLIGVRRRLSNRVVRHLNEDVASIYSNQGDKLVAPRTNIGVSIDLDDRVSWI